MPKKHRNSIINKQGMRLLESLCPDHWILNPPVEDYGWDYHVDLTDSNGITSGKSFYIQLKSHAAMTFSADGSFYSESIDREHLRDWKARNLPMFLCCADLQNQEIYWCFVQKYLDDNRHWHSVRDFSIKIFKKDKLSDTCLFLNAINEAILYLGSFEKAEQNIIAAYRQKYPNLEISIDYIRGKKILKGQPNFPVHASLNIDEQKLTLSALSYSFDLEMFFPEDIKLKKLISGDMSPCQVIKTSCPDLFVNLSNLEMRVSNNRRKANAHLQIKDCNGYEMQRMDGFSGFVSSFAEILCYEFKHQSGVVEFNSYHGESHLLLDYSFWNNCEIINLPYIEVMDSFFNYEKYNFSLSLVVNIDNNYVDVVIPSLPAGLERIGNRIQLLRRASVAFKRLKLSISVKEFDEFLTKTETFKKYTALICAIYRQEWAVDVTNILDIVRVLQGQREVIAHEDNSLHTTLVEEEEFFGTSIRLTTDVVFTHLEPTPDGKRLQLKETPESKILFKLRKAELI